MKRRTIYLLVALILVVGAYSAYRYLYKDHRSIATEDAVLTATTSELKNVFLENTSSDILNKTVSVVGRITQIEENTITLDDAVQCSFDAAVTGLAEGDAVTVKGRCIGYDDLFEIVKLDQSTLTNQP